MINCQLRPQMTSYSQDLQVPKVRIIPSVSHSLNFNWIICKVKGKDVIIPEGFEEANVGWKPYILPTKGGGNVGPQNHSVQSLVAQ